MYKTCVFFYKLLLVVIVSALVTQTVSAGGNFLVERGTAPKINWAVGNGATQCTGSTDYPNVDGIRGTWNGSIRNGAGSTTLPIALAATNIAYAFTCTESSQGISDTANLTIEDCGGSLSPGRTFWNNTACVVPLTTTGTLTLSASTCQIAINSSSCNVNATWTTTNPVGPSTVTTPINGTLYTANNGGPSPVPATGIGTTNFYLYNPGSVPALDMKSVTPTCAPGSSWNGSLCLVDTPGAVPVTTFTFDDQVTVNYNISYSATPIVKWSATNNPTSCTASGDWGGSVAVSNSGTPTAPATYPFYTFTLACSNENGTSTPVTRTLTVCPQATPTWNGSSCVAAAIPIVTAYWSPTSITSGQTSTYGYTISGATPDSCSGSLSGGATVGPVGLPVTSASAVSSALTSNTTFSITCLKGGISYPSSATLSINAPGSCANGAQDPPVCTPPPPPPSGSCNYTVNWAPGCSGNATMAQGSQITVTNTASGYTGNASVRCDDASINAMTFIGSPICTPAVTSSDCPITTKTWGSCTGPTIFSALNGEMTVASDANSYSVVGSYVGSAGYTCNNGVLSAPIFQSCQQILCPNATDTTGQYVPCSGTCANGGTPYPECPYPPGVNLQPNITTTVLTAVVGVPLTISAQVRNAWGTNTLTGFNNVFHKTSNNNIVGSVMSTPVLNGWASAPIGTTFTATNADLNGSVTGNSTFQYRLCVDRSSATDSGVISELDENDNCSSPVTMNVKACANDTISYPECNQCPANLYWTGSGCAPCLYGGCTGPGGNPTTPVPPTLLCNNGANNAWQCNQCPANLTWNTTSNSCVPCGGAGCTGTVGGSTSNPVGNLVCNDGPQADPPTCSFFSADPSPCYILDGASTCLTDLNWSVKYDVIDTSNFTYIAQNQTTRNVTGLSSTVMYGGTTFNIPGIPNHFMWLLVADGPTSTTVDGQCLVGSTFDTGTNMCVSGGYTWVCSESGVHGPDYRAPTCDASTVGNTSGGYYWQWDWDTFSNVRYGTEPCTCTGPATPLPDLTTGATDKVVFPFGSATVVTAPVTNIGNANVSGTFQTFFQTTSNASNLGNNYNPAGPYTEYSGTAITNLTSAQSKNTQHTFTFNAAQTGSMRACADKSSAGDGGVISEADDNNNCSPWVNFTVTPPPPAPTGFLSASPNTCSIQVGQSTCPVTLTWSTLNPVGTSGITRDGTAGQLYTSNNSPVGGQIVNVPYEADGSVIYRLYNDAIERANTTITITCEDGSWDTLYSRCANPGVVEPVIIEGLYYPPGAFRFSCINSTHYTILKAGAVFRATTTYNGEETIPVTDEAQYIVRCLSGNVADSEPVYYSSTPDPTLINLKISPASLAEKDDVVISWDTKFPTNACSLYASVVCANNACGAAQLAASTTLNQTLKTTTTDRNDPSGERLLQTAVKTVAPGHKDRADPILILTDWKALGKKTIEIQYTTDFIYDCGGGNKVTRRVKVTKEVEQ